MIVINQKDTEASVGLNLDTENGRTFYVRFYDEDTESDFVRVAEALCKRDSLLEVTESKGTYIVSEAIDWKDDKNDMSSWDVLMHKCFVLSNEIRKDPVSGQKFYLVRFSKDFIYPCGMKMVV